MNEALNENGRSLELRESLTNWDDDPKKCFGMLTDGGAQVTGIRRRVQDATLSLVIHGYAEMVDFDLPECPVVGPTSPMN